MIKFEHTQVLGLEAAIRGMRNPKNSWDKSDSKFTLIDYCYEKEEIDVAKMCGMVYPEIGPDDLKLMKRLCKAGSVHRKFIRMINVYVDITAPLYWWKEFDTYKVGTVTNSCSTMHKIADNEFTLDDFSCEHLIVRNDRLCYVSPTDILLSIIEMLNKCRELYLETNDKKYWWQMIQLLPSSYNQKRTVMMNYEVLANIYQVDCRRHHKLDEWCEHSCITSNAEEWGERIYFGFCDWIETLPYSELITEYSQKGE